MCPDVSADSEIYEDEATLERLEVALRKFRRDQLLKPARGSKLNLWLTIARAAFWALGLSMMVCAAGNIRIGIGVGVFSAASVSLFGANFHDTVHKPSRKRTIGRRAVLRLTASPFGVSPLWWSYKHVRLHHQFPSHPEFDPDIQFGLFGRVSPLQPWRKMHRWQHLYFWFLLPFSALNMLKPGEGRQSREFARRTGIEAGFAPRRCYADKYVPFAIFWLLIYISTGLGRAVGLFLSSFLLVGLLISLITQVQHNTMLTLPASKIPERYSLVHQVCSSSDVGKAYGPWWLFCGGVNLHAAHHLIPSIEYAGLPAATAELVELLDEYSIKLRVHPNIFAAIRSHRQLVSLLSNPEFTGTIIK